MTMTEQKLYWYRTTQVCRADKIVYTNDIEFVGYYTEQDYQTIDKHNLIYIGYGTIDVIKKEAEKGITK